MENAKEIFEKVNVNIGGLRDIHKEDLDKLKVVLDIKTGQIIFKPNQIS